MEEACRRRAVGASRLSIVALLAILVTGSLLNAVPAAASSGIGIFVGYADSLRANPTNFPTPWFGSPNTVFYGCAPATACIYDAGGVRIVNNTGSSVTVNAVAVHVDTCTFGGWPPAVLTPGADLIVTQLSTGGTGVGCAEPSHMDTSDVGRGGVLWTRHCDASGILPTVDITINGQMTTYTDSGQVLNTGGVDAAYCPPPGGNESSQWTAIGNGPCRGSLLSLSPPTQMHGVGTTATVTATFTNSCTNPLDNQPLSNVAVNFNALAGPNAGRTGSSATDANGQATFSYSSVLTGTDTLRASVINLAGTILSNNVNVIWLPYAPGGGAFVISDRENVQGGSVYWWGAQWWKKDPLNTGLAPAAFKGFEKSNLSPWCGQTWMTRPGNSPPPPRTVSTSMLVIVSSHITKKGAVISGDIVHIVLVTTSPGYAPNPGHVGTGTIAKQLC